jgi:hypothetical protein
MDRLRLLALSGIIGLACEAAHAQSTNDTQSANDTRSLNTPRAGPGYTNGWSLMTPDERHDYAVRMKAMTSAYACRAFVEQHHRLMVERARASNADIPPPARLDVCDGLPK